VWTRVENVNWHPCYCDLMVSFWWQQEYRSSPHWLDAGGETRHHHQRFQLEWSADINSRQKTMERADPLCVSDAERICLRPTQPSIPPGSVNEYQLRLGRQRQVWFIPLNAGCAGETVRSLKNACHTWAP